MSVGGLAARLVGAEGLLLAVAGGRCGYAGLRDVLPRSPNRRGPWQLLLAGHRDGRRRCGCACWAVAKFSCASLCCAVSAARRSVMVAASSCRRCRSAAISVNSPWKPAPASRRCSRSRSAFITSALASPKARSACWMTRRCSSTAIAASKAAFSLSRAQPLIFPGHR